MLASWRVNTPPTMRRVGCRQRQRQNAHNFWRLCDSGRLPAALRRLPASRDIQGVAFSSHANPVKEKGCRPAARGTPAKGYSRTAQPTPRSTGRGLCCFDYSRAFRPSFAVFREAVLTLRVNSDCQRKSITFFRCCKCPRSPLGTYQNGHISPLSAAAGFATAAR